MRALHCFGLVVLVACGYPDGQVEVPEPQSSDFAQTAYPVLLGDCGFPACHGTHDRFFQVFGPGRTRLLPETAPYDPVTQAELELTLSRSRSMLIDPKGIEHSLLLRKPLAIAAGGAGHEGDDSWGRAVYGAKDDDGWGVLHEWSLTAEKAQEGAP